MRKVPATLLALPVIALVYLGVLGRARGARVGAGLVAAVVVALVAVAGLPRPSVAVPASPAPAPVDAQVIEAVATGHGLREPLKVAFDAPMDPSSVAAAMRLTPDAAVRFSWDGSGKVLTIEPVTTWQADTLYVLTVSTAARAADGGTLAKAIRATVLTSRAGTASIAATRATGKRARIDTAFRITLDRPATLAAVRAAIRTEPAIEGTVSAGAGDRQYLFTPAASLAGGITYRISLDGLVDTDGVLFGALPELTVTTGDAPAVVRFRPLGGTDKVDRAALVSVRFTDRMDREATAAAFKVTADGKPVAGSVSWAEDGTVLVFDPKELLPYGAKVIARVDAAAVSRAGARIAAEANVTFTVAPKPKIPPTKPQPKKPATKPIPRTGGGGGAVRGSWYGVETYYLRLMNCTRTGGWVTSTGKCSSPGGRNVRALTLNSGISRNVSRPYAKLLATRNICDHFVGGTPGDRLRRQGYTSFRWGENLGCRSGNPYNAVLGSHRYFQSEKPYNGGHYRNLMDARFHQVGIGVWVSHGRVRLVIDFYTP